MTRMADVVLQQSRYSIISTSLLPELERRIFACANTKVEGSFVPVVKLIIEVMLIIEVLNLAAT